MSGQRDIVETKDILKRNIIEYLDFRELQKKKILIKGKKLWKWI
jgi:hypothetical protein